MRQLIILLALLASGVVWGQTSISIDALKSADYYAGKESFQGRCSACHTLAADSMDLTGPNLWRIFSRKVGERPGFEYSEAMKSANFQWSPEQLHQFVKKPAALIPGTAMTIPEPVPAKERLNMISFMMVETGAADWPRPATATASITDDRSLSPEQRFPSFWNHMMKNTVRYRMVSGEQELVFEAYFHPSGLVSTNSSAVGFWYITEKDFMCYAIHKLKIKPSEFVECFPVAAMAVPRFAQELWHSKPTDGVVLYGGIMPGRPE